MITKVKHCSGEISILLINRRKMVLERSLSTIIYLSFINRLNKTILNEMNKNYLNFLDKYFTIKNN